MHASVYEWVGKTVAEHELGALATLEVGSGIVNGTVRDYFSGPYVGVDIGAGSGVDRVEDCTNLSDGDNTWDVVISTEMLEHVDRPWLAVNELARVCAASGHVIITCRGYDQRGCWEPHGYPHDSYRYSDRALIALAEDAGLRVLEITSDPEGPGWFLHAVKG